MFEKISFLAAYGFGYYDGSGFGTLLSYWEQVGVFSYIIPFLLIFAIIYGILMQINLFKGTKGINAVVSVSVALLSLQFSFVSVFFSEIFPKVGVGMIIILLLLIFTGMFMNTNDRWMMYLIWGIAIIILLYIVSSSFWNLFGGFGSFGLYNLGWDWNMILSIAALIAVLGVIIGASRPRNEEPYNSVLGELLTGERVKRKSIGG